MANVLFGIASVLDMFLQVYMFIVLGRVIISWVNADPYNPIVRILMRATEPLFRKLRRYLPFLRNVGGLDFTPLVALGIIYFLQYALVANLFDYARSLKGGF